MYVTAHAVSMVLIVILKMWVNYAVDVDFKNNIIQIISKLRLFKK